jgi:TrmH family RNA methyltransferase
VQGQLVHDHGEQTTVSGEHWQRGLCPAGAIELGAVPGTSAGKSDAAEGQARNVRKKSSDEVVAEIRRLRTPRERERTRTFYAEGTHIVAQAVQAGLEIQYCVVAPGLLTSAYGWQAVETIKANDVPVVELNVPAFKSLSFKENLQGIGVVVRSRVQPLETLDLAGTLGCVALDAVGNPGNLGAILRTCDAVGCGGLVMLGDTTDPYNPAAIRASMGAVFWQPLVRATFPEFLEWARRHGYQVMGTSPAAEYEYQDAEYPAPIVLLMGSERTGLSSEKASLCDQLVRIPMIGVGDSLNLAVATSIVLYEAFHRNRS